MAPARPRFTEARLERTLKATREAGLSLRSIRIMPDGTILLHPGPPVDDPGDEGAAPNPWDEDVDGV